MRWWEPPEWFHQNTGWGSGDAHLGRVWAVVWPAVQAPHHVCWYIKARIVCLLSCADINLWHCIILSLPHYPRAGLNQSPSPLDTYGVFRILLSLCCFAPWQHIHLSICLSVCLCLTPNEWRFTTALSEFAFQRYSLLSCHSKDMMMVISKQTMIKPERVVIFHKSTLNTVIDKQI